LQTELYSLMFEQERTYWWAQGRRDLTLAISSAGLPSDHRCARNILDVGCGTGALLEVLAEEGVPHGVDSSELALAFCLRAGCTKLARASAEDLPFRSGTMDLLTSLDVFEHVPDDGKAARECFRILRPGGLLIVMVPAFQWLWTDRDDRLGHVRRYRKHEIARLLSEAGFRVERCTYTNISLVPVLMAAVLRGKLFESQRHVSTDIAAVPKTINTLLYTLVRLENAIALRLGLPFGTTVLAVAKKPADSQAEG